MNTFMRFPKGRLKAVTLSYDDGMDQDIRLIEIMKKNGLKGTFNLNSGLYAPEGTVYPEDQIWVRRMSRSQAIQLYKNSGMEVAVHGKEHPYLEQLPVNLCTLDIMQDRENLEEEYDVIVRGMAYPYGTFNDEVVALLKELGFQYARTVNESCNFDVQTDLLRFKPTCHHDNARLFELAEQFLSMEPEEPQIFYIWGHSYEFDGNENWDRIEELCRMLAGRDDIFYGTNAEVLL